MEQKVSIARGHDEIVPLAGQLIIVLLNFKHAAQPTFFLINIVSPAS